MEVRRNIRVITRNFDTGRIKEEFEELDKAIREMEGDLKQTVILAKRKANVRLSCVAVRIC